MLFKNASMHRLAVALFLTSIILSSSIGAEPLQSKENGAIERQNNELGVPVEKARIQLERHLESGALDKFYRVGVSLVRVLSKNRGDLASVQVFVDTATYILKQPNTSTDFPYGGPFLFYNKGPIAEILVGSDYISILPEPERKRIRGVIIATMVSLFTNLRSEAESDALILPTVSEEWKKNGLSDEERERLLVKANEQLKQVTFASIAVIAHKKIPTMADELESKFLRFLEREYKQVPPEKGEIEKILATKGLSQNTRDRLSALGK